MKLWKVLVWLALAVMLWAFVAPSMAVGGLTSPATLFFFACATLAGYGALNAIDDDSAHEFPDMVINLVVAGAVTLFFGVLPGFASMFWAVSAALIYFVVAVALFGVAAYIAFKDLRVAKVG